MATIRTTLTPVADTTPAAVEVPAGELSGAQWIPRFPGSNRVEDCHSPFRESLVLFVNALRAAGASVTISATVRPKERAYLMHWSWRIVRQGFAPQEVPPMEGVNIIWAHPDPNNSVAGAQAMVEGYGTTRLGTRPAIASKHTVGLAVDMTIAWTGALKIVDMLGNVVEITSEPRTGLNRDLHPVGASYGVIKYNRSGVDQPHWSDAGD